jgi:hypothetical protein
LPSSTIEITANVAEKRRSRLNKSLPILPNIMTKSSNSNVYLATLYNL